jgi:succinate dehydrogenase/fumarate reductase flavoprotein subunit
MTSAGYAASRGARVIVVDKAPAIGGSAVLSGRYLWTARTYRDLRERCPNGDPILGEVFLKRFPKAVEWVRSTGVDVAEPVDVVYGRGHRIDVLGYMKWNQDVVEHAGGCVLLSKTVDGLIVERDAVVGAIVREDAAVTEIRTPAVILATGGFQGNHALLHKQFGENARQLLLRANYCSSGDGLQLGIRAGAATAGDMSTFYGHLIAWPLPEFVPKDFIPFTMQYTDEDLLLNLSGQRFTDESPGDYANVQAAVKQPHARAVLLMDETLRSSRAISPIATGMEAIDTFEESRRAGAHVAWAVTLRELAEAIGAWGFDVRDLQSVVDGYNNAIRDGSDPTPPRRWNRRIFGPGPFYAIEVRPAITFTEGGLKIDERARVLDRNVQPIPGLLAAGADTGGIYNGGYAGGLALACVFGLTAADTVMGTRLFA